MSEPRCISRLQRKTRKDTRNNANHDIKQIKKNVSWLWANKDMKLDVGFPWGRTHLASLWKANESMGMNIMIKNWLNEIIVIEYKFCRVECHRNCVHNSVAFDKLFLITVDVRWICYVYDRRFENTFELLDTREENPDSNMVLTVIPKTHTMRRPKLSLDCNTYPRERNVQSACA